MMSKLLTATMLVCWAAAGSAQAQIALGPATNVDFADVEQGKRILTARDDFVQRLSPFDRAARLKTERAVTEQEYLDFVADKVRAWTDDEKKRVTAAMAELTPALTAMKLPWPPQILLIKTTGDEEGRAAYTRANAIVLPERELARGGRSLARLICHELFHVLSRANPALRDRCYAVIGFEKCAELNFPSELLPRKITNPDAPCNAHCIQLHLDGRACWAVPILFARTAKYDAARGGEFFDYLRFQLLLVERDAATAAVKPCYVDGHPELIGVPHDADFFTQVGKNTGYIIHPEEILADSFAILVLGRRNPSSPEILDKLRKTLSNLK